MTMSLASHEPHGNNMVVWVLVLFVPLLLAADLSQRSNELIHLPEPETYRSNLSDQTLKSSTWRQPTPNIPDWRTPSSPQIEWRSDAVPQAPRANERTDVELYPQYSPGETSTFDLSTREDQSGFKVFEFDFGR